MVKSNNLKLTLCAAMALAGSLLPVSAGTATVSGKESKTVIEESKKSAITGDLGVNIVSQYVWNGIIQENQGFIAQPYLNLYFNLYEGDGALNKVSFILGAWSSLHSNHTGAIAGSTTSPWYEFDSSAGLAFTFARDFTLTTSYISYASPNDAFDTCGALNLRLDYNDSNLLGALALHPHVTFLREINGKAGSGDSRGNYYEVGIAPGLPAFGPVTVTVPVTAGFGSHDFYATDETFGYVSAGVNVAVALTFIPEAYGSWTANAGATYYYLHGSLASANDVQPNVHNDFVFSGGVGLAF